MNRIDETTNFEFLTGMNLKDRTKLDINENGELILTYEDNRDPLLRPVVDGKRKVNMNKISDTNLDLKLHFSLPETQINKI